MNKINILAEELRGSGISNPNNPGLHFFNFTSDDDYIKSWKINSHQSLDKRFEHLNNFNLCHCPINNGVKICRC